MSICSCCRRRIVVSSTQGPAREQDAGLRPRPTRVFARLCARPAPRSTAGNQSRTNRRGRPWRQGAVAPSAPSATAPVSPTHGAGTCRSSRRISRRGGGGGCGGCRYGGAAGGSRTQSEALASTPTTECQAASQPAAPRGDITILVTALACSRLPSLCGSLRRPEREKGH